MKSYTAVPVDNGVTNPGDGSGRYAGFATGQTVVLVSEPPTLLPPLEQIVLCRSKYVCLYFANRHRAQWVDAEDIGQAPFMMVEPVNMDAKQTAFVDHRPRNFVAEPSGVTTYAFQLADTQLTYIRPLVV